MKSHSQQRIFKIRSFLFHFPQTGDTDFNRGMMFNIGYKMAMNLTNNFWQCFIFHDVDLLPEDDRNIYACSDNPRHMSVGKNLINSLKVLKRCRNNLLSIYKNLVSRDQYQVIFWGHPQWTFDIEQAGFQKLSIFLLK